MDKRREAIHTAIESAEWDGHAERWNVTAFEQALRDAGFVVVPVEPTEAMIEAYKAATWQPGAMDGLPKNGPGKKREAERRKAIARYRAMIQKAGG